jgi:hypothetical protein
MRFPFNLISFSESQTVKSYPSDSLKFGEVMAGIGTNLRCIEGDFKIWEYFVEKFLLAHHKRRIFDKITSLRFAFYFKPVTVLGVGLADLINHLYHLFVLLRSDTSYRRT